MKIALFTPYNGDNLGDAAIQEAVIANIRLRIPNATICMVTLSPERTSRLHGLPSFSAMPSAVFYSTPSSPASSLHIAAEARQDSGDSVHSDREDNPTESPRSALVFFKTIRTLISRLRRVYWSVSVQAVHTVQVFKLLRSIDLLIVSGGGQLDDYWGGPWGQPYALLKWGILARLTGTRYVFLSVGTCALESRISRFFISRALALADYRSYRDNTSKALLEHLTVTRSDNVYPDLAFSYLPQIQQVSTSRTDAQVIGVSPIAYLSKYDWPRQDTQVYENYFGSLVSTVATLLGKGHSVVLFTTGAPDRKVATDIIVALEREHNIVAGRLRCARTNTLDALIRELSKLDCVIASRLHGVLISTLCGLPVLALSYDRKVDTYMEDSGLSDYCLDIHDINVASILDRFSQLAQNLTMIRNRLASNNRRFFASLMEQYDAVLGATK